METNKQEYYRIKEDIGILNKIARQIDTLSEIINTYGITAFKDMSIVDIKEFLEDRFIKIDNETFERFNTLINNQPSNKQKEEFLKLFADLKKNN